jgi:hypothetical protein
MFPGVVDIEIRDVPDDVRDRLTARAALLGESLEEYLLRLLTEEALVPTNAEVIARVRAVGGGTHVAPGHGADAVHEARREAGRE